MISHVMYSIFLLIMAFLILTNWKGFVEIMKTGGSSGSTLISTLQGRR